MMLHAKILSFERIIPVNTSINKTIKKLDILINFRCDVNNHNIWWILYSENMPLHSLLPKSTQVLYYKTQFKRLQIYKVNVLQISNVTINKTKWYAKALLKNEYNSHRETQNWHSVKWIHSLSTEQLQCQRPSEITGLLNIRQEIISGNINLLCIFLNWLFLFYPGLTPTWTIKTFHDLLLPYNSYSLKWGRGGDTVFKKRNSLFLQERAFTLSVPKSPFLPQFEWSQAVRVLTKLHT